MNEDNVHVLFKENIESFQIRMVIDNREIFKIDSEV